MSEATIQKKPTNNMLGAIWSLGSALGFTIFLLLSKLLSENHNPGYLAFWRTAIALVIILPYVLLRARYAFKIYKPKLVVLRSLIGTVGFLLSMFAVSDAFGLALSEVNAISFSRALFVTVLAALILRERVGTHRWGAVVVGFVGVIIMLKPDLIFFWMDAPASSATANPNAALGAMMALASAFFLAMAIILVKSLTAQHSPMTLLLWASILSTILLAPFLFFNPSQPSPQEWGLIILMALAGTGAQFCYISAMSVGDASFISPLDYIRLPFAAVADWFAFKLLPGAFVWLGAAIIILSTLYITLRERLKDSNNDKS